MGKEIQIVGQDNRPIIEGTYDIPAGLFVRENVIWAKYTDPETLETKETNVFDGAGTVLPTPTAADNGKVLGVVGGAYAFVEGGGAGALSIDVVEGKFVINY